MEYAERASNLFLNKSNKVSGIDEFLVMLEPVAVLETGL